MPDKPLPIYQIQDFNKKTFSESGFYLNRFEAHLKTHAFVQKPHRHDFYIVLYITNGAGTHTIDFKTFPVAAGSVFFLSPGQAHSWELSPETGGYILFFTKAFYLSGKADSGMFRFPFFSLNQPPVLQLAETEKQEFLSALHEIEKEYLHSRWKKETILRNLLENLLIRFSRKFREAAGENVNHPNRASVLQQLEDLVDAHFKEHKPVAFYAEALHITLKQLNELAGQHLGKSTTEIIQDRLVLEAQRLFTHSGLTISQVAAELGFFDNSYFSRFFKKKTSLTPEQFRQRIK